MKKIYIIPQIHVCEVDLRESCLISASIGGVDTEDSRKVKEFVDWDDATLWE